MTDVDSIAAQCREALAVPHTGGLWRPHVDIQVQNEAGDCSHDEWAQGEDGTVLFGMSNSRVLIDAPGNLPLAALAPAAAGEVARVADELDRLAAWHEAQDGAVHRDAAARIRAVMAGSQ